MNWSFLYIQILISIAIALGTLILTIIDILPLKVLIGLVPILILLAILRNSIDKRTSNKPHISTMANCVQDESAGWFRDPTTDNIFCSKCWYSNKIVTPLIKNRDILTGWICPKCLKTYTSLARMFRQYLVGSQFAKQHKIQSKKKHYFGNK